MFYRCYKSIRDGTCCCLEPCTLCEEIPWTDVSGCIYSCICCPFRTADKIDRAVNLAIKLACFLFLAWLISTIYFFQDQLKTFVPSQTTITSAFRIQATNITDTFKYYLRGSLNNNNNGTNNT